MPMILKFTCLYPFSNAKESLEKLQHCVIAVSAWMTGSRLKREKILNNSLCLISRSNPSASAKNLGVVFDSSPDFRKDNYKKRHIQYIPNM